MKFESCTGNGLVAIRYEEDEGRLGVDEFSERLGSFMRKQFPRKQWAYQFADTSLNLVFVQLVEEPTDAC